MRSTRRWLPTKTSRSSSCDPQKSSSLRWRPLAIVTPPGSTGTATVMKWPILHRRALGAVNTLSWRTRTLHPVDGSDHHRDPRRRGCTAPANCFRTTDRAASFFKTKCPGSLRSGAAPQSGRSRSWPVQRVTTISNGALPLFVCGHDVEDGVETSYFEKPSDRGRRSEDGQAPARVLQPLVLGHNHAEARGIHE